MTCQCGAEFCYDCGHRFINFGPLYGHLRKKQFKFIPYFSCSKLWKSQTKRIAVHTAISAGIVTLGVIFSPVVIIGIPSLLVVNAIRRRLEILDVE